MMKDVIIKIKGTQGIDGEQDEIELTTDGRFGKRGDSYYMTYDESAMLGIDSVKTSIYIKPDNSVILQRTGAVESRLVVESGKRSSCYYNTAQGELIIGIFGETVKTELGLNGGKIHMCYTVDSNLKLISRNTVDITVREV